MTTENHSQLDRLLSAVHPRRAVAALAAGLASLVLLRTADVDPGPDAVARRRKAEVQGPCGDGSGRDNRCKKNSDCCTGYCDRKEHRCRYKKAGASCTSDEQCRGTATCVENICVREQSTWSPSTTFGSGPGSDPADLERPWDVAVSPDTLTAWVADNGNGRISVWTRSSNTSTVWSHSINFGTYGSGETNLSSPRGVAVSTDTLTVWVADTSNSRISVWTRPSDTSTDWSHSVNFGSGPGSGADNLNYPGGVAVSADGRTAWVADSENHRISVWTRSTDTSTDWSHSVNFGSGPGSGDAEFNTPEHVAISPDTLTAWVADTSNNRISVWNRPDANSTNWNHSVNFGSGPGSGEAEFDYSYGVAVSTDTLTTWVVDISNNRISVWNRPDTSSTNWSHSVNFGSGPGSGAAEFNYPSNVTVSADGRTAWVADTNGPNYRISIWTYS